MLGELRDVYEALDARDDLDEGAEGNDLGDLALQRIARLVLVEPSPPGLLLRLLEPKRDSLALAVDVEDLHADRFAHREDLGRVVHMAPGKLRDVDQAVDPVEIDEGAEVDDVGDLALDDHPGLQPPEDLLADLLALLLQDGAPREHHVVAAAVELDDLPLERLALELVQVVDAPDVDERCWQEAAPAQVEDQPSLDALDHGPLDRLARFGGRLDLAPGLLEAGPLLGEQQAPPLVLLGEHERGALPAEGALVSRVDRAADRELVRGDDALRLVADVDQDLVLVDADDLAADDVALLEGLEGGVVFWDQLAVDLDHEVVRARRGRLRGAVGGRPGRRIGRGHGA